MKKTFTLVFLLLFFSHLPLPAQDFRAIRDGVEYAETVRGTKETPVRINLLRLDLKKVRLDVVHAMDAAIGLEKTSSIAMRYGAIAAINAGFFRLDKSIFAGDATGVLKVNHQILSEPFNNRIALFIDNSGSETKVLFDRLKFFYRFEIKSLYLDVNGINRERKDDEIILFNSKFHPTTLTNNDGVEIVIRKDKIAQIFDGKGSNPIPADGFILSASGAKRTEILRAAKIGAKVEQLLYLMDPEDFQKGNYKFQLQKPYFDSEDIVGGVPQLIKNGRIEITWE